jgi:4-amino-4-deoxy-L-arabinose transferase-like glycosyltransferase
MATTPSAPVVVDDDRTSVPRSAGAKRRFAWILVGLCLVSVAITWAVSARVFPAGSPNLDEVAYEAQARAIRNGQLVLPADDVPPGFAPYLSGRNDDGDVVFKYQPLWPALIAASLATTDSTLPIRLLLTAAGVLAVAWFAHELIGSRRVALAAAAISVASPFTWLLSATILGYQLSFVLVACAAAALLRTERRPTLGAAALAGALLGAAVLHRPYDTVLAIGPVLVLVGWRACRQTTWTRLAAGLAIGGLPFAVVLAWVNTVVMGAPWKLPFNASGGIDTFGFGWRASFVVPGAGTDGQLNFTPGLSWRSQGPTMKAFARVLVAAPVVLALAGWSFFRHRDRRALLLGTMTASVIVGYGFWWGVANLLQFHLDASMGPVYHYPLLLPVAVAGGWGVVDLVERFSGTTRQLLLPLIGLAAVIGWSFVGIRTVDRARNDGGERRAELALLNGEAPSLGLQPPAFPGDPYVRVANEPDLSGPHVFGVDVPDHRLDNALRFADRNLVLVRDRHTVDDLFGPMVRDRVEPRLVRGARLVFTATGDSAATPDGTLRWRLSDATNMANDRRGSGGELTLIAADLRDGQKVSVVIGSGSGSDSEPGSGSDATTATFQLRWDVRRVGDGLVVLDQPDEIQYYDFGEGRTARAPTDLTGVLSGGVTPTS